MTEPNGPTPSGAEPAPAEPTTTTADPVPAPEPTIIVAPLPPGQIGVDAAEYEALNAEVTRLQAEVGSLQATRWRVQAVITNTFYVDANDEEEARRWYAANFHLAVPASSETSLTILPPVSPVI